MCSDKEFLRKYKLLDEEQRKCIRRLRAINKKIERGEIRPEGCHLPLHFPSTQLSD